MTRIETIMSRRIVAIRSDCELSVAADTFLRYAVRHLVVVDPDRSVRGILSAEDVVLAAGASGSRRIGDQALLTPQGVHPEDDVRVAADAMLDRMVEAVLVTEGTGHVIGIVTWSDLVAHVARDAGRRDPAPLAGAPSVRASRTCPAEALRYQ
jgi:acetoin utilization protein AcuB